MTPPKFCQLLNTRPDSGSVSKDLEIRASIPDREEMLGAETSFPSPALSPFPVAARVKSSPLSLHGAAASQPWSRFKPCGSEQASSCQKTPNLSIPGPLRGRVSGQGHQRLALLFNANQPARVEGSPVGAWLSFSSTQRPSRSLGWRTSALIGPIAPHRSETAL